MLNPLTISNSSYEEIHKAFEELKETHLNTTKQRLNRRNLLKEEERATLDENFAKLFVEIIHKDS